MERPMTSGTGAEEDINTYVRKDRSIVRWIDWLIDWVIGWFIDRVIDWLIDQIGFIDSIMVWSIDWLIDYPLTIFLPWLSEFFLSSGIDTRHKSPPSLSTDLR